MERTIEEKINKILINFAKKNKGVLAIYQGHDPEGRNSVVYYFIKDTLRYDRKFTDELSDLDIKILEEFRESVALIHWPITIEDTKKYRFLKRCIYERD